MPRFQILCRALAVLAWTLLLLAATAARAADPPTVLITGANRGIGLELARQYAERGWRVIATARKPAEARDLAAIAARHPLVAVEALDVADHGQIEALAAKYRDQPLDVLINNAGISGGHDKARFGQMDYAVYAQVHAVNVLGPLKMAEAFLPQVSASAQKKIINISSTQGSITQTWGCCYFYRSSKAALNMASRTLAVELKKQGITVGIVSPGFVRTGFTPGLDNPAMITPEESARSVIRVIDDYDLEDSGTFMDHHGKVVPW